MLQLAEKFRPIANNSEGLQPLACSQDKIVLIYLLKIALLFLNAAYVYCRALNSDGGLETWSRLET